ncbi:hypothetical protein H2248_007453 [Termitomyces sp. 'cryptogamus']|nr:hypothetical protein H2248_007453 [Termitomyces sp. 'cryptogamus']
MEALTPKSGTPIANSKRSTVLPSAVRVDALSLEEQLSLKKLQSPNKLSIPSKSPFRPSARTPRKRFFPDAGDSSHLETTQGAGCTPVERAR